MASRLRRTEARDMKKKRRRRRGTKGEEKEAAEDETGGRVTERERGGSERGRERMSPGKTVAR